MINLRYHIVSVVAVFLALGIGLALGSTFVDSILVNELEDQVNQLDVAQEEAVELKNQAIAERDREAQNNQTLRTQIAALEDDHLAKLAALQAANDQKRQALIEQAELETESTKLLLNSVETLMPRGRLSGTSLGSTSPNCGRPLGCGGNPRNPDPIGRQLSRNVMDSTEHELRRRNSWPLASGI